MNGEWATERDIAAIAARGRATAEETVALLAEVGRLRQRLVLESDLEDRDTAEAERDAALAEGGRLSAKVNEQIARAAAAEAEVERLRGRLRALRALHVQPSPRVHNCAECDGLWPCATRKILDA